MGLHICYDLSLPGEIPDARILEVLGELSTLATRPGVRVAPMFRFTLATLLSKPPFVWHNLDRFFPFCASLQLRERDGMVAYRDADRERIAAIGFAIHPGRGSEAATFGFVRPLVEAPAPDAEVPEKCGAWYWHGCCKTQYASVVSDEHLVRCHLLIVELLEALQRMGVEVDVRDETGYWETRSTAHLITEVAKMNAIVARFAGAFHDAMPPGLRAEGAIFEHPEFERLETMEERTVVPRPRRVRNAELADEQPGSAFEYLIASGVEDGGPPDVSARPDYYLYGGGYKVWFDDQAAAKKATRGRVR